MTSSPEYAAALLRDNPDNASRRCCMIRSHPGRWPQRADPDSDVLFEVGSRSDLPSMTEIGREGTDARVAFCCLVDISPIWKRTAL
jgi:hypothetical protein